MIQYTDRPSVIVYCLLIKHVSLILELILTSLSIFTSESARAAKASLIFQKTSLSPAIQTERQNFKKFLEVAKIKIRASNDVIISAED